MENPKEPLVSVLLPVYNGASHISRALQGVISQGYANWEVLIIDDGSTDGTEVLVSEFSRKDARIRYLKNERNLGIQKTLNRGLAEAKGMYIARVDHDDVWVEREKLEKQVSFIERNKEYVLIGTGVILLDSKSQEMFRYLTTEDDESIRKQILGKNCFAHSSVLFKKEAAILFGGYDESEASRHVEDYDLWLKLGTVGKMHNIPIFGVALMVRDESISSRNKVDQFRKNLSLIIKFKNKYPGYLSAGLKALARLVLYAVFRILPVKGGEKFVRKIYRKLWG